MPLIYRDVFSLPSVIFFYQPLGGPPGLPGKSSRSFGRDLIGTPQVLRGDCWWLLFWARMNSSWRFFFQEQPQFCCKETNRPNCSTQFLLVQKLDLFHLRIALLEFPWSQEHHQGFRQLPGPGGANDWFATSWVKAKRRRESGFRSAGLPPKKSQQAYPSPSTAS